MEFDQFHYEIVKTNFESFSSTFRICSVVGFERLVYLGPPEDFRVESERFCDVLRRYAYVMNAANDASRMRDYAGEVRSCEENEDQDSAACPKETPLI